ncbi:hypothetical protein EMGBS15_09190 [Filimonas sp.]|nr:hypothetical protein EMGBS15_09190 [Filimonas sp.]
MKNPKWHRDEIILTLDLYFDKERGAISNNNPKLIEVSEILNDLPLFPNRPDELKFRNINGVKLKLGNFMAIDPDYKGKGMEGGSKLDKLVFDEYYYQRDKLKKIANEIRAITRDTEIKQKIYSVEEDEMSITDSVMEGQVLYKLHKVRERDTNIIKSKKEQHYLLFGQLSCEACVFEFESFYGPLGKGYIECHHRTPLASLELATLTKLDDLALVCSNCHRMLHRSNEFLSIEDLKMKIKYDRPI